MWKTVTPDPEPTRSVLDKGSIRLSIGPYEQNIAQHFSLDLCRFSNQPHEQCLKMWPREAILLAREELDRFESQIAEEG